MGDSPKAHHRHKRTTRAVTKLKHFLHKHRKWLLTVFFIVAFLATFIISVAGGLRVFFPYLGELTGFPFGQKNYLVIFQNNNELRPAGGFISSFGVIQMTAGFPSKIQIEDVYGSIDEHDYIEAPYPMEKLLANEWYRGYTFRDGNYSPNYPDTALELVKMYKQNRPDEHIDGVIAVNFSLLESLLETLGPIEVDGVYLTNDNLFEELTNQVNDVDKHNIDSLANRKSVLKPLSNAIIWKIILNPFKLRKISDVVTRGMATKELQLYFDNTVLQELAVKNRWAGQWPQQVEGDFLAVNEANLGGMKSDRYISRKVDYHVRISEEYFSDGTLPEANVSVELEHYGIENIPLSGPYTGYFRIYNHPEQSEQSYSLSAAGSEAGRSKPFEEIIKILPGEGKTITAKYHLTGQVIQDDVYSLYIPKQAGTAGDLYTVIIELPRGYRVESDNFKARENFGYYQGFLTKDLELNLKILEDTTPPRIVHQQNTQLNHISIHFNEDLNQDYANDPFSYEVTDLNIKNSATSDNLRIKNIETTSKDIQIYTTGQTKQHEERYSVRIKNLRDTHGNVLSDREITVVQRLQ